MSASGGGGALPTAAAALPPLVVRVARHWLDRTIEHRLDRIAVRRKFGAAAAVVVAKNHWYQLML